MTDAAARSVGDELAGERGSVELQGVTKRFGSMVAVDQLDLVVHPGEFLSLLSIFRASRSALPDASCDWMFEWSQTAAFIATTGVVLGAAYMLWLYRKVVFGALTKPALAGIHDLSARENLILMPLVVLTILFGIYPKPILDMSSRAVAQVVTTYSQAK